MRQANFVEETTTSIAGTSGDGAVTLTQITSTPRFSTALGSGDVVVRYTIEDTVSKKFETGVGIISANVLTRTDPQVTWDGTTWDDTSPSPLQFGATPTSGDVRIRLAPTAEGVFAEVPRQSTLGSDTWVRYRKSAHMQNHANGQEHVLTADVEYYNLYRLDNAGQLDGFRIESTTGQAGGNVKAALYSLGATGLPTRKIVQFNTISVATSGVKSDTTTSTWSPAGPIMLTPSWYAIGLISNVGLKIRALNFGQRGYYGTPFGRHGYYGEASALSVAGSYASGMPTTPSLGSASLITPGGTGDMLWLGLRVEP